MKTDRKAKKLIALILILILVMGTVTPVTAQSNQPASNATNIHTASAWARDNISQAFELGLVPQNLMRNYTANITRAEFAALAVAFYESTPERVITARAQFNDTNDINVQKMGGLEVVDGVGGGNFAPNRTITRQEAAVMLARLAYAVGEPLPPAESTFYDNDRLAPWAIDAVGRVQAAGIMGGIGNNTFHPNGTYTREQSIATMLRLLVPEERITARPNARNIQRPMVALTFDDGPSAHTGRILDVLERHDARATFFVIGRRLRARPEVALRAHQSGHEVANHLYHHQSMTALDNAGIIRDLRAGSEAIIAITGESPPIMRPPGGAFNDRVSRVVGAEGYALIMWSIDTNDWRDRNANTVYQRIMSNVRDGDIILLHDTHGTTAAAMERVIPSLIQRGFTLVTVSELLYYTYGEIQSGRVYYHAR